jgi:hypothetical protein
MISTLNTRSAVSAVLSCVEGKKTQPLRTIDHTGLLGGARDSLPHAVPALVVLPIDLAQPQPFLAVHLAAKQE